MRGFPANPSSAPSDPYNLILVPTRIQLRSIARLLLLSAMALFAAAPPAHAKIQTNVDVGWSKLFRPGRWTPLYITLSDSAPRQVSIDIYCPTDRRYALRAMQNLTIGPSPVTVALYAPLSYRVDESVITIRDAASGKRLDDVVLSDNPAYPGNVRGLEAVDGSAVLIAVSGSAMTARPLESQISQRTIVRTAIIAQPLLPAVAIGYESLDLLILSQPDANHLQIDQQ